ncbi:MAG: hypothetical protein QF684_05215 [Candidatus Thalassarchaeaceae archaeon]|nr:hypothetical protein [Candidatus Thalassarchaeaceae archaeon]
MADIKPVVMVPDDNARAYAESSAPAREEEGGPALHATDEMRRLATPWTVAIARAHLLESCDISQGVILDPACGSATQLAALCSTLNRPGLGVELSGAAAPLAAINLEQCSVWSGGDWGHSSRILWGDGTVAESILQTYHHNIGVTSAIALLHIDPARPQDAQKHTLEEMQPRLDHLLSSWAPFLPREPALILDLSPRLSDEQRLQVESIISSIWGDVKTTWQWMTQGRGRIDRLSLWVGPVADPQSYRLVRLTKSGNMNILTGLQKVPVNEGRPVEVGQHLTIVDPSLVASQLTESWRERAVADGDGNWLNLTGRRPTFISSEAIMDNEAVKGFVQITGQIVGTASEVSFESLSELATTANQLGLSSLKLRCQIEPDIQPKLQSAIDREMKQFGSEVNTSQGFITEAGEGYAICNQA